MGVLCWRGTARRVPYGSTYRALGHVSDTAILVDGISGKRALLNPADCEKCNEQTHVALLRRASTAPDGIPLRCRQVVSMAFALAKHLRSICRPRRHSSHEAMRP